MGPPGARQNLRSRHLPGALALLVLVCLPHAAASQSTTEASGAELYRSACAACHGADGKGAPRSLVGFETALPDFTDCSFATTEADLDWMAVVHQGGRARGFDRMMPAFGDALSETEIARVVSHLRTFCADPRWPRGDLNLPRPLVTEKAFPENEAVMTTSISTGEQKAVVHELLYERRVGRRGQWEAVIPLTTQETADSGWRRSLGDIALAFKHVVFESLPRGSILSAGGELVLPTARESDGIGRGTAIFEPFGTFSQLLPRDGFLHLHGGFELPARTERASKEAFWRAALGKTYAEGRWGRTWSPIVEVLGARELVAGEGALWDVLPQLQVSLSTRQHVLLNAGVRVPLNRRDERSTALTFYLLWDWFDGGLATGW